MWDKTRLGEVVHSMLWFLVENLVDFVGTMEGVGEWVFFELERSPENKQGKAIEDWIQNYPLRLWKSLGNTLSLEPSSGGYFQKTVADRREGEKMCLIWSTWLFRCEFVKYLTKILFYSVLPYCNGLWNLFKIPQGVISYVLVPHLFRSSADNIVLWCCFWQAFQMW